MGLKDNNGAAQTKRITVTVKAGDHVEAVLMSAGQNTDCRFDGHIWTETDLDGYDVFREHADPAKRQQFYRVVKGSYICTGMDEHGTWAALINE